MCLLHRNEEQNDVELFCVENLISLSSKSIRIKTFFPTCFNETSWANYIHMGYNYKFLNLVFFYVGKQKELFNESTMTMFMISCLLQTWKIFVSIIQHLNENARCLYNNIRKKTIVLKLFWKPSRVRRLLENIFHKIWKLNMFHHSGHVHVATNKFFYILDTMWSNKQFSFKNTPRSIYS